MKRTLNDVYTATESNTERIDDLENIIEKMNIQIQQLRDEIHTLKTVIENNHKTFNMLIQQTIEKPKYLTHINNAVDSDTSSSVDETEFIEKHKPPMIKHRRRTLT